MRNKKKLGIVIGRFQLFHNGHKFLIDKALKDCDKVLIFIGSSYRSRNIQNPFSFEERREMIQSIYNKSNKIRIFPLRDYLYDDEVWKEQDFWEVKKIVWKEDCKIPSNENLYKLKELWK